jgi:hypothetical protein
MWPVEVSIVSPCRAAGRSGAQHGDWAWLDVNEPVVHCQTFPHMSYSP